MRAAGARGALVAATLALALAACGGEGPIATDGGPEQDAPGDAAGCVVGVQFTPSMPTAPAVVVAEADAIDAVGIVDYQWSVQRGGADLPFTTLDVMGRDIQFDASAPGVYAITAMATGCTPSYNELNVATSGANERAMRMHFVPPAGVGVPPQEKVVTVPGGGDYSLGTVVLDPGVVTPVTVRTAGGAPLAAYLRFTSRTTPDAFVEAWSGAAGTAEVRLAGGHQDVLVVPDGDVAPVLVSDWDPAGGTLTVADGASWTGTVVDAGGVAVAGARVSLTSGGVPSTVATTDAAGHFTVRWRDAAGTEQVVVVPPPGRGLPRLDFDLTVPATPTTIRFGAVATWALGGVQVQVGGAPAADADVSIALALPAAATVELPPAPPVSVAGGESLLLRTGADGRLPAATAIAAPGAIFVGAAGGGARASIDLTAGVGAVLAASPA
ncbi:MAG TPA: carboxypeptidase-like regulatory domain-containing protein, partial [Kofleriaceae bacterium]|nr:carboxypeptidase-like regulatory domain-containing protein [Kofleriaceae bacterium]